MEKVIIRRTIKASAMRNMQGSWMKSFLIILIMSLASMLILGFLPVRTPDMTEVFSAGEDMEKMLMLFLPEEITGRTLASVGVTLLLYMLVMCPCSVGSARFYLRVARGEKSTLRDFFSVFSDLKLVLNSVLLNVIIFVVSLFWYFIISLVPALIVGAATVLKSELLMLLGVLLMSAASIIAMTWISRYTFATYILAEGKTGAFGAFAQCRRLVKGRGRECMSLRVSYFGWDIACSLIPMLSFALQFIYNALSSTVYARYLYHFRGDSPIILHKITKEEADENKNS